MARPFSEIPGPPARFLVGEMLAFKDKMPWDVCANYGQNYGPMTRIRVLGSSIVVLNGPEQVADVLIHKKDAYIKDRPRKALLPLSTEAGVFVSPGGSHWEKLRKAMPASKPNYAAWLASRLPDMQALIEARCRSLLEESRFDAYKVLHRLAFDVVSVASLGRELGDEAYQCFLDLADLGDRRMRWRLPFGMPWGRKGDELLRRWFGYFQEAAAETRRSPEGKNNVFTLQLNAGSTLSDEAMGIDCANDYFGGCFSATTSVLTTLYDLSHATESRDSLIASLKKLAQDGGLHDLRALLSHEPLDHALRESMRLRPAVALFVRQVKPGTSTELGGYEIPAKTMTFISCYALHHDRAHWGEDADSFRPSRWEGGVAKDNPFGSDYFFPFGRGERSCIGEQFALCYIKLVLATVLSVGVPEVGVGQAFEPELFFATMRPKGLLGKLVKN